MIIAGLALLYLYVSTLSSLARFLPDSMLLISVFSFFVADIRMSKPAEVEKVGVDSPMEGTGIIKEREREGTNKWHVLTHAYSEHTQRVVIVLAISSYVFLTFSSPRLHRFRTEWT